jgi:pimeloyl-ACP methyl ester carboxylesterase
MDRAVLSLLVVFICAAQSTPLRSTAELQVKKLKVNDVELAYVEEGTGETVVFVHGFTGDWRTWEPLRPLMSEKYRYVSISRRCHYPAMGACSDDTASQHVEDVATFVRVLNVGKVHLVGNSGGGRIVGLVALKYPDLIRSVVMGEPGLIASTSPEGRAATAAFQEQRAKVLAAAQADDAITAMRIHYDAIAGEDGAWDRLPADRQQQRLANFHTVVRTLTTTEVPLTCEQLRAFSVPALVVTGEKSPAHFRYRTETLLGCLPRSTERVTIPGGHHEWYAGNPQASANAILTFLAKH